MTNVDTADTLHSRITSWFTVAGRDLPWRGADPWSVLVSEFMLQQTPVSRVLPVFEAWMDRWPTPAALAADASGDAVRAWGRLGYPRRALRLHAAAAVIVERHGGQVPAGYDALLELPGVGDYTAAAVASFAFGQAHPVLDTNVRRVFARAITGTEFAAMSVTAAERQLAINLMPDTGADHWAAATMELGALVCTAKSPHCAACPVEDLCAWNLAGKPSHSGPARRGQAWAGTDRQVRGKLLAVLRESDGPVEKLALDAVWPDPNQRERCLDSLVADGLVEPITDHHFALPGSPSSPGSPSGR